jgi:hypothetical protein
MSQCIGVVGKMLPVQPPNLPNLKRKSFSDPNEQPMKRQAVRQITPLEPTAAPPRSIQPRPPQNGYPSAAQASGSPSTTATGKKRGRPSKADKEAQARANSSRATEYANIIPAPMAPVTNAPQREYASSPGYEISAELKSKRQVRTDGSDGSPAGGAYPLPSPASAVETPRAFPEPHEQAEHLRLSPRDRLLPAIETRSTLPPPLHQINQSQPRTVSQPHPPSHSQSQPQPQSHVSPGPGQPSRQSPAAYEPYRGRDPIFPDRDRSRAVSDHIPRSTPPTSSMANAT